MCSIGFGGTGRQVREALHPHDFVPLLRRQMTDPAATPTWPRTVDLGGGEANVFSLADLGAWCADRYGAHPVDADPTPRRFDIPRLLMDSTLARGARSWQLGASLEEILLEIAVHAEKHPGWLELSAAL